jgi:hypothetical protein
MRQRSSIPLYTPSNSPEARPNDKLQIANDKYRGFLERFCKRLLFVICHLSFLLVRQVRSLSCILTRSAKESARILCITRPR